MRSAGAKTDPTHGKDTTEANEEADGQSQL